MASSPSCRHQPGAEHHEVLRPLSLLGDGILFGAGNMLPFQRAAERLRDLPHRRLRQGR